MRFRELHIEEFQTAHNVTVNLERRGLVLVQGKNRDAQAFDSNGAGKSTIFSDAPMWCLFGETARGLKGDSVVNRFVGKNTMVSLEVVDDNGDTYEVTRYRKHSKLKNSVTLSHNGKMITAKSDEDTNMLIRDLLQIDFPSATNSIVFGQGISKMFASATDGEQKKILELMLQIDIFKACQETAKKRLAGVEKLSGEAQSEMAGKEANVRRLKLEVSDLQVKESERDQLIAGKISELEQKKASYSQELEGLMDVTSKQAEIAVLESLVDKCNAKILGYKTQEKQKSELDGEITALNREIYKIGADILSAEKRLNDIKDGKNIPDVCKACGQSIPTKDTSHLEAHIAEEIEAFNDLLKEKVIDKDELQVLVGKVGKSLEGKDVLTEQVSDLQKSINALHREVSQVTERGKTLRSLIKSVDSQIDEYEAMKGTTYTELIEQYIEQAKTLEVESGDLQLLIDKLSKEIDIFNFWVNGFGNQGIKSLLLDSVTPYLNSRANHYLSQLTDNTIEVKFSTQAELKSGEKRDKFSVGVTNLNGDSEYKGNSNGEKRRIDLGVNMALQDLVGSRSNKKIDFIVYDEAFEGLDAIGCERLIGILEEKARLYGTVIVITHNESLKELFSKTILVEKKDRETVLKEDLA